MVVMEQGIKEDIERVRERWIIKCRDFRTLDVLEKAIVTLHFFEDRKSVSRCLKRCIPMSHVFDDHEVSEIIERARKASVRKVIGYVMDMLLSPSMRETHEKTFLRLIACGFNGLRQWDVSEYWGIKDPDPDNSWKGVEHRDSIGSEINEWWSWGRYMTYMEPRVDEWLRKMQGAGLDHALIMKIMALN